MIRKFDVLVKLGKGNRIQKNGKHEESLTVISLSLSLFHRCLKVFKISEIRDENGDNR
jgi:hypothetical protein